jgi:amino acid transporter
VLKELTAVKLEGECAMQLVSYILWIIIAPVIIALIDQKLLKRTWIILSGEIFIVVLLTFIGIIENNPTGNMQRQLASYFGDITNDFYLKYIPFILATVILLQFIKKKPFYAKR